MGDRRGRPALYAKGFNRKIFAKPGKGVIVGINVNCIGWNTQQWQTRIGTSATS